MNLSHIRGDTLALVGTAKITDGAVITTNFTGYLIRCQIRVASSRAIQPGVMAAWIDAALGTYQVTAPAAAVATWVTGKCNLDVEVTDLAGVVLSTPIQTLDVLPDVTV